MRQPVTGVAADRSLSESVKLGTTRRRRHGAGQPLRSRRPVCAGFALGLLAALAALVWLGYLLSEEPPASGGLTAALGSTLALPAVAGTLAFAVVLLGGWCVRNLRLEYLAWAPGNIAIADLVGPASLAPAEVAWLSGLLRERLTRLSLQAPTPVPGAAAEGSYLDVLSKATLDVRNPLSLLQILRGVWPSHAYTVEATLQAGRKKGGGRCCVRAQVTRLPRESTFISGRGRSWEEAVRNAADEATAVILPRTRLCVGQWGSWRGYVMPPGLLAAYERAVGHEVAAAEAGGAAAPAETEYRAALKCYGKALKQDLFNLAIRLRMGQVQEKLGLDLQALATYQEIVTVTRPAGEQLPRALYRRRARRERGQLISIARYRRAVLLGGGDVASQWVEGDARTVPSRLREGLAPLLVEEVERCAGKLVCEPERPAVEPGQPRQPQKLRLHEPSFARGRTLGELLPCLFATETAGPEVFGQVLKKVAGASIAQQELAVLQALLAALGYASSQDLLYDRAVRRGLRRAALQERLPRLRRLARPAVPFTLKALRLSQLCIQLRLSHALDETRLTAHGLRLSDWESDAAAAAKRVVELIDGRVRQWHEGYNAACACSIPLCYGCRPEADLPGLAIMWLERASACADSAFVAGQREWVQQDPDLEGLRREPDFEVWWRVYFPGQALPAPAPAHAAASGHGAPAPGGAPAPAQV